MSSLGHELGTGRCRLKEDQSEGLETTKTKPTQCPPPHFFSKEEAQPRVTENQEPVFL